MPSDNLIIAILFITTCCLFAIGFHAHYEHWNDWGTQTLAAHYAR